MHKLCVFSYSLFVHFIVYKFYAVAPLLGFARTVVLCEVRSFPGRRFHISSIFSMLNFLKIVLRTFDVMIALL